MNSLSPVACLTLVAALHSQNSFVVPSANKSKSGNTHDSFIFFGIPFGQPAHVQLVYSTSDITIQSGLIKALSFRRPNTHSNANPAATANISINMSVGPNDAAATSSTFASNLGVFRTTVFNGNLSLPAAPYSGPGPAPFTLQIPFTNLFPYVPASGRGLVADLVVATYTPATSAHWYLDSHGIEGGSRASNGNAQSTCKFSNGSYNDDLSYPADRYPGSPWHVTYNRLLPNAPGVGAIGNTGVGRNWGAVVLPVNLAPLGAPGCGWHTNIHFTVGLLADGFGRATWPTITIPSDPSLANAVFYDHAVFLDPAANAAGIVTTWSSKWVIGSVPPEGSQVHTIGLSFPTGTLRRLAVIAEFAY
jgi:hypothetical protein